jgi:cytochrome c oxidase accessory protein FixG
MNTDFRETLYTIDKRGQRKWVYSHLIKGRFFQRRAVVIYLLMAVYLLMPWVVVGGEQAVFFDLPHRRFAFFGNIFFATDTFFLFLIIFGLAIALFFFTSILGRVWCGWACPETVFLEFLFRPLERLIEGAPAARLKLDQSPWSVRKARIKATKYLVFVIAAWILASTFLAYFIGRNQLIDMMQGAPWQHPTPFFLTLFQMAIVLFQFGWFREQFCTVLCPYARFQSVLMDGNSLGVGYDPVRGEPRQKPKNKQASTATAGDCVDCGLCVRVCPTGIDIRNGLQLECIHCAQCIDACDSVMDKVGKPRGLIRYDTENRLFAREGKFLRPRIFVYGLILFTIVLIFSYRLFTRSEIEAQILRGGLDVPFSVAADGRIVNHLTLKVHNKSAVRHAVSIRAHAGVAVDALIPGAPFPLAAEAIETIPLFITFSADVLEGGKRNVMLELVSETGQVIPLSITVLGPG